MGDFAAVVVLLVVVYARVCVRGGGGRGGAGALAEINWTKHTMTPPVQKPIPHCDSSPLAPADAPVTVTWFAAISPTLLSLVSPTLCFATTRERQGAG